MTTETRAFMDATCKKCGKRIGWFGRAVNMPTCPRCGAEPDRAALERDQTIMDDFRDLLEELRERSASPGRLRQARLAAGLTLIQAARLFQIEAPVLAMIERGEASPTREFAGRMAECYGGEPLKPEATK